MANKNHDQNLIWGWTVGDDFRRRHDNILRDIRELIEKVERSEERTGKISRLKSEPPNFIESTYIDSRNKEYPEYLLPKDGFTLLVMGFVGR
jgi:Rha family phage regulatory protein